MQAVILAGGEGYRLRPLTRSHPKVMLPVANRPIIDYVIEALVKNGIRDIIIVAGYRHEQLIRYLNDLDINVKIAVQKKQLGAADALMCAKDMISGDFLLLPGDNYIDAESISRIKNEKNAMLVAKHPYPSNYGVVETENGFVKEIVEKPEVSGDMTVSTGIFSLSRDFTEFLSGYQIPDAISSMVKHGMKIKAIAAAGWHDAIYPWDLLVMNKITLEYAKNFLSGEISRNSVISGKVSIGRGSKVSPFAVIIGPVVIGEDSYIGPNTCIMPYTSIGSRVRVEPFTCVENSVIMSDSIIGSHSKVEKAVIGEGSVLSDHTSVVPGIYLNETDGKIIKGEFGAVIGEGTYSAPFTVYSHCVVGNMSRVETGRVIEGSLPDNTIVR
ncbi:glucose-1-phosphate thymidylyltransferase [Methanomicrobium sp. W14]|uniref:sugar phosphate nucleotidyltransferase n=1 Tax=Methanomicrobium sp. W14 TaxID=2817839 RepID=UPI001AE6EC3D|nr:sugar phosphate nucleotidyltransferase [Methanomicrobium sp. W14]MBP2133864.1 glucose-1-phosphate thymidylyltransferase [Methanomicrobium sp. W14]